MKKNILGIISVLVIAIALISLSNYIATNIDSIDEVKQGIAEYRKISNDIEILETKKDENEYFVVYSTEEIPIALCIFEETFISFAKYYNATGGARGGLLEDFVFSEGSNGGVDALTVAFGYSNELEFGYYNVHIDDEIIQVSVDNNDIFLDVYRKFFNESGRIFIEYNVNGS